MGEGTELRCYSSATSWHFLLHPSVHQDYSFREMEERERCRRAKSGVRGEERSIIVSYNN